MAPTPALMSNAANAPAGQVVVVQGDTLFAIAKAHKLTPDKLATLNGLKDPNALAVGQVLKLS